MSEKREAWDLYSAFMLRAGFSFPQEVIGYKGFCRMWTRDFSWVKTKRRKTIASKCFVCEDLEVWLGIPHSGASGVGAGGGGGGDTGAAPTVIAQPG